MRRDLEALLRHGPVAAADHPDLRAALRWAHHRGDLVAIAPGLYAAAGDDTLTWVRAAAGCRLYRAGVVTGMAAAALTYWPEAAPGAITLAAPGVVTQREGFVVERRSISPDLVLDRGDVRLTVPELTVLDLIPDLGGKAIDEALRRRAVSMRSLEATLADTPGRRGNRLRARLISESRDEPWSEFERQAHLRLRRGGIGGWKANHLVLVEGRRFYLDVAFPARRLACEFDSFEHHGSLHAFMADRERDRLLQLAGWHVLRFCWGDLDTMVEVVHRRLVQLERAA